MKGSFVQQGCICLPKEVVGVHRYRSTCASFWYQKWSERGAFSIPMLSLNASKLLLLLESCQGQTELMLRQIFLSLVRIFFQALLTTPYSKMENKINNFDMQFHIMDAVRTHLIKYICEKAFSFFHSRQIPKRDTGWCGHHIFNNVFYIDMIFHTDKFYIYKFCWSS